MDPALGGYGYSQAFTQHSSSGFSSVSSSWGPPTTSPNYLASTQSSLSNFELSDTNWTHGMQSQRSDYPAAVQSAPHIESQYTRSARQSTSRVTEFSVPFHRIHEVDTQAPPRGYVDDISRPRFPVSNAQRHTLISNFQEMTPFESFHIQASPSHIHAPAPQRRIDIAPIEQGVRTYPGPTRSESMAHNARPDYAASIIQGAWPMATPQFAGHGQAFEDVTMQQAQSQEFMDWITAMNEDSGTANLGIDMQGLPTHIRRHSEPANIRQTSSSLRRDARSVHGIHSPKTQRGLDEAIPNSKGSGTDPTDYFTMLANWDQRPDAMLGAQSANRNGCGTTANTPTPHGVTASGIGTASLTTTSGLDPIAAFELYNTLVPRNQPTTSDLSQDTTLPFLGPFGIPSYSPLRPDQLTRPVLRWYCKTGAIHLCSCEKRFRHCRDLYRHVAERGSNHSIAASTPQAVWVCPLCVRFQRAEVRILLDHMEEEHGVDFTDALRDTDTDEDRTPIPTVDSCGLALPGGRSSQEGAPSSIAPPEPPKPKHRKKKTAEEKAQEMAALPDRNVISAENLFYQYFNQVYKLWNPAEKSDDERRGDKRTMSVWSVVESTPQSLRQWNRAATKFAGMGNASEVVSQMIAGGSLPCPSSVKRFNKDTKWDSLPQFITFGPAIFL
ncbi:hypothetical protein FA13DRAFT_1787301 [Coprinellus micaceus]|uniref:Uncharacterized protein n=1 Tax=Coprinellus micaceus TaxID=71717 RepID=A0A4Y7TS69_COPMI|nr:hypothetical protein FA13DRAFT_1787301 [Coprinellus micaceus]